jgi:hypothetical protein
MCLDDFTEMSNQELISAGRRQMDQTDQAIERSKMVHNKHTPFILSFLTNK